MSRLEGYPLPTSKAVPPPLVRCVTAAGSCDAARQHGMLAIFTICTQLNVRSSLVRVQDLTYHGEWFRSTFLDEDLPGQFHGSISATQVDHVLQIFPALLRPAVITRLVLGAHQRIRPTATISGKVHIAVSPLDRLLHMRAFCFDGFESPGLALRIGKEAAQFRAMTTLTGEHAGPAPVMRRRQRLRQSGHAGAQDRHHAAAGPPALGQSSSEPGPAWPGPERYPTL